MRRRYLIISFIIVTILMIGMTSRNIINENTKEVISSPSYITDNSYSSKSIIALDISNNDILYEKNIHKQMLPASLTKVLTCIVAIEHYKLDDYVIINYDMVNVEGSRIYLEVGDVISVKDLLYGLMLYSGNDAALALAYHYSGNINDFIYLMNETCKKLKMNNSIFHNPHGLDSSNENLTTAYDLAILFSYALKNNTFREITKTKTYHCEIYSERNFLFRNKHRLIHSSSYATGGKTGYTKKAGRTLITSFKNLESEVVVVTLDAYNDWFIHEDLGKKCLEYLNKARLKNSSEYLSTFFYFKRSKTRYLDE